MSRFTYATICSGVECCSLALNAAPPTRGAWQPIFFSEIAPFQSALLAHYYPSVPNLGDMTKIEANESEITNGATHIQLPGRLDLLAGGTPCQDFSTAGKRAGAAQGSGTRSSLCWEYLRLISQLRPRVVLWENVTGCLSTNGGGDFSRFVAEIARIGYGVAWRVLDCQHTRVDCWPMAIPQRRNRLWLVGCADGDIDGAAKILFEPKGVLGDNQPRREVGEANPKRPTSSAGECYPTIIARTQALSNQGVFGGELIVAPTLTTAFGSTPNSCEPLEGRIIVEPQAETLRTTARRLTPLECERLMGYPDNYTRIPYRGKPAEQCPDGPRYEACGNGWAINCARWVLLGIHRYLTERSAQ